MLGSELTRAGAPQLPSLRQVYVDVFNSKDELIDACMASAHIPFFLNGKPGKRLTPQAEALKGPQTLILWPSSLDGRPGTRPRRLGGCCYLEV